MTRRPQPRPFYSEPTPREAPHKSLRAPAGPPWPPPPAKLIHVESEATQAAPAPSHPAWQRVLLARHPKRPHSLDYIERLLTGFQEIHGDRSFADDPAIVAGM